MFFGSDFKLRPVSQLILPLGCETVPYNGGNETKITVNIYLMYQIMCYQISDCTVQSATVSEAMLSIEKVCRQLGSLITPSIKCPESMSIALVQNTDQMTHEAQLPFKMPFRHTLGTTGDRLVLSLGHVIR